MKQYTWLIALCLTFVLFSCDPYNEHQDVTGIVTWKADEKHTFQVPIEDNSKAYNVLISLRHTPNLKVKDFNLALTITNPDGTSETKDTPLPIKSAGGEMLGSCAGDLCDTETLILQNHKFPAAGTYTFEMVAKTEKDIPNVLEIGLMMKFAE